MQRKRAGAARRRAGLIEKHAELRDGRVPRACERVGEFGLGNREADVLLAGLIEDACGEGRGLHGHAFVGGPDGRDYRRHLGLRERILGIHRRARGTHGGVEDVQEICHPLLPR
jgi:hypothetical protein